VSAILIYKGVLISVARPGRKQSRKHVRDARDFNNIEMQAVIKLFSLQGKAPKEIHAILTETFACFLPGRAKDLSAPLYIFLVHSHVAWGRDYGKDGRSIKHIFTQRQQNCKCEQNCYQK